MRAVSPRYVGMGRWAAMVQGGYFALTGVWPLARMGSFLWITGPKVDLWLVETVGATIAVVGVALFVAGYRRAVTLEIALLGMGAAAALGAVEARYAVVGRIRWVYLADAALELGFIAWWAASLALAGRRHSPGM